MTDNSTTEITFNDAVTEFTRLQDKYMYLHGTCDTEPDTIFQTILYNAIHGTDIQYRDRVEFPTTAEDWDLPVPDEGDEASAERVAGELTAAARVVVAAAQREPEAAQRYEADGHLWRFRRFRDDD